MSLITDTNAKRDPSNDARVVIPRINVALQATPGPPLGPTPGIQRPTDGGATAQELAAQGVSPSTVVGNTVPTLMAPSGFDTTVANANETLRAEFNWRRNAYTSMAPAPLFDSRMATPWSQQAPILNSQLQAPAPKPSNEALSDQLALITGINPRTGARSNAFTQGNLINRNRDGTQADGLGEVMRGLGFRNDNWFTRGVANLAGVGGAAVNLTEMVENATTGWLFDNTLGRAIYGTPQASQLQREVGRATDYLQPSRELGTYFLTPNDDADSTFGAYGSGLPGAINMVSDYVPNLITGTGLSAWRGAQTIQHALRGEEYGYQWDAPMWNALNPLTSNEVYSFMEDPRYSPVAIRQYAPPPLAEGATNAERFARRATIVGLTAAGFLLDAGRPDINSISDIGRWATRSSGGAARNIGDAIPAPRPGPGSPAPTQAMLSPGPTQNYLPGYTAITPDAPPLGTIVTPPPAPGGALARTVEYYGAAPIPEGRYLDGGADMSSGSLGGTYETVFVSPDGTVVQVPRNYLPNVEEMTALPESSTFDAFVTQPQIVDANRPNVFSGSSDPARLEPGSDPFNPQPGPETQPLDAPNAATATPDAPSDPLAARADATRADTSATVEELVQQADAIVPPAQLIPAEQLPPVRGAGVAETIVAQSVKQGDVEVRAQALVRSGDAIQEAQKRLIAVKLESEAINRIPEGFRNGAERARLAELEAEFAGLRTTIAGRTPKAVRPVIDDALPIVPQTTLNPPANPAALYQWSRNLPSGQRIYLDGADFEPRSAQDITELAKFFGHADAARSRVLSGDMISQLRVQYGSLYSNYGPPIDRKALKRLNVEGAGRIETQVMDEVLGVPQESRVYSNPLTRRVDETIKRADEFGSPRSYTASQMSGLGDEEVTRLLDTQFSQKAVYASGTRDPQLARTRAELMDESRFRQGAKLADGAEPDDAEIDDYLESMGEPDFDVNALDDDSFGELAERAALNAERKAAVPVSKVKVTLPNGSRPDSVEGDKAIREMIAAEQGVGDSMQPVRELTAMIEDLERQLTIDGRKLSQERLPQDLNVGTYAENSQWRTRQMQVDELADKTTRELQRIQDNTASANPGRVNRRNATPEQRALMDKTGQDYIDPTVASRSEIDSTFPDVAATARKAEQMGFKGADDYEIVARFMANGAARQPDRIDFANLQPVRFTDAVSIPKPVSGRSTSMGNMPEAGAKVTLLDGRNGELTGSMFGTGRDAEWEVRLPDGTTYQAPRRELFPEGANVSRPDPASTKVWYLGTRADVPIENYSGLYDGPTHNAMGPGTYLVSDPKVAEDAARGFVRENNIANYPIAQQGNVHRLTADVQNVMSGDMQLVSMENVWTGMRGLIKEFFTDPSDVRNITAAARKKNIVEFYDYLARKLDDDVRLVDFESRAAVFLHAQGIDAIHWDSPNGSVLNVIKPQALTPGDTTPVGGSRALEQFAASTNYDQAMANTFGTRTAQAVAEHSHYRFGMQLRDKLVGHLQEASRRVNQAIDRLDRADEALEDIAARDAKVKAKADAARAEDNFGKYMDTHLADQAKGCL